MKNTKRAVSSFACLLLCLVLLLCMTGCDDKSAAKYKYSTPESFDVLKTTCVAENGRYSLIWNHISKKVVLYDKIKNCEWSYVPQESLNTSYDAEGNEANVHPMILSPIVVSFYSNSTRIENTTNAYAQCINKKDGFTLAKIDNGIEMMLYFDKYEFAVPVQFILNEDGMDIRVDVERIQENSEYNIQGITIAPFTCSVANTYSGDKDHYLFVPSGSGAIINPVYTDGVGTRYSEFMYGGDANIDKLELTTVREDMKMPVYGAVNGDRAMCAIIKEGSECSRLNIVMGQALTGYSYIDADFLIRGYQTVVQNLFTQNVVKVNLYADAFTEDNIVVGFYPLYDDDASYVGFANTYRKYLEKENLVSSEKSDDNLLNLKFVGGITTKKFTMGIPSGSMVTATTVNQVRKIVTDLTENGMADMNVNLIGFGTSGNDIGKVAGGCKIGKYFGDDDDIVKLSKYCKNNGHTLFMNFDMVRFSSSGCGVNTTFGKADSATSSFTTKDYYDVNFRTPSGDPYYLVARGKLNTVAGKISEAASDWKLQGVSLDTLTSIVYSDYNDEQFYAGAHTDDQVADIIGGFEKDGLEVAGSYANSFAAGLCSHVYDVPDKSARNRIFTEEVPFYEIVFKGRVSMSPTSLNLATSKQETLLKSVESGLGLTYTLIGSYDTELVNAKQNVFYGSLYWDESIGRGVKTDIIETVNEYKPYFESVNGAAIVDHEIIAPGVHKTVFDNGVAVCVNYNTTDYEGEIGKIPARGYINVKGGAAA